MNLIFQHIVLFGIGAAIAGTALIFVIGNFCARLASRREFSAIIKSQRTIRWDEVIRHCRTKPGLIVIERNSSPRRIWFLTNDDGAAIPSTRGSLRAMGLLVLDTPSANQLSEVESVGGRVVEINPNSAFW